MKSMQARSVFPVFCASLLAVAFPALEAAAQSPQARTSELLDEALAGSHRSEQNKARDRYRHPKETLEFFGFRADMTVVEIWPGGGWYTEVLAPALTAGGGTLYAAQYGPDAPFPYQRREMEALAGKIERYPNLYDSVVLTDLGSTGDLEIAPPASADLVVTFRNVHNWFDPNYGQEPGEIFKALFDALKPGGTLGVVDHRWPDPATEDPQAAAGYVSEQRAIEYAQAAGFELSGRSEINANPRDTHDHPQGVWTLPPDLALGDQDRQKYLDIGESDRFTLKFLKPPL